MRPEKRGGESWCMRSGEYRSEVGKRNAGAGLGRAYYRAMPRKWDNIHKAIATYPPNINSIMLDPFF